MEWRQIWVTVIGHDGEGEKDIAYECVSCGEVTPEPYPSHKCMEDSDD